MGCVHGRVSPSRQKLDQLLPQSYEKFTEVGDEIKKMMSYRINTIKLMNPVADKLEKKHKDINTAKLVSSTTSVVGAAITGVGIVLTPLTLGASAVVAAGGAAMMGARTAKTTSAQEEVIEKEYLDKVQRAVDKDKKQCEKVKALWKEFENYCSKVIDTILLADTSREADMQILYRYITEAMKEIKSGVTVIYVAFCDAKKILGIANTQPSAEALCNALLEASKKISSKIPVIKFNELACIFILILATIGVEDFCVLIKTAIDVHNGSLLKAAIHIREKSSQLDVEYNEWKKTFSPDT